MPDVTKNLNLFLRGFYAFTKVLVSFTFKIFFRKNTIIGKERLGFEGPSIVVANHPQTLFDPLVVAVRVPRIFFFLANYSIFNTPFRDWFFRTFYCIPVRRRKEDAKMGHLDNNKSLSDASIHLSRGGCLFVAPEGASRIERRIRPLKTGAARIAFDAESSNDWNLGLTIFPFGNNFESVTRFRKDFVLNVGHHIRVADFKADFEKDEKEAIYKLTDAISVQLKSLTITIQNVQDERAFRQIETIFQNENKGLSGEEDYQNRKVLSEKFLKLKEEKPADFEAIKSNTLEYKKYLQAWRLSDKAIKECMFTKLQKFSKHGVSFSIWRILKLIFTFPIFIWGYLNNFFPYQIGKYFSSNPKLFVGYRNTAKYLSGLVFVPVFYLIQSFLVGYFWNGWAALIYFFMLIPTGLIAWWWKEEYLVFRQKCRLRAIEKKRPEKVEELKNLRESITAILAVLPQ